MSKPSFRIIWITCSVVLLLGSFIFASLKEILASQDYVIEQWNAYLTANYPLLNKIGKYEPISKEEASEIQRLGKIVETEYEHKKREFRAEYENNHAGQYFLMFAIFNIIANLAAYAVFRSVYRAH